MTRNLDVTALRSFVAVAEVGGVTRAANLLHLTQSAVSMQMKRLEDALGLRLLDRSARSVTPTAAGEQLLGYARQILALNDEAVARLTDAAYEGEMTLGVPNDIVYPHIPAVLRRFAVEFPRMQVNLISSYTIRLKEFLERGTCEVILTTEDGLDSGGETLASLPLLWVGAPGGQAWRARPLRLAFEHGCIFRAGVQAALDRAGISWVMAVESDLGRTVEAMVSADLAVNAAIEGSASPYLEPIAHDGALPELEGKHINLYAAPGSDEPRGRMVDLLRQAYGGGAAPARPAVAVA